jgi:hypothetical protein
MPRICAFYGIVIGMYFNDHDFGQPHFHAAYAEFEASIRISDLGVIEGDLPRRAERLVREWATQHQEELMENWRRARDRRPLLRVNPLD